jgi:hypothetical protein
MSSIAYVTFDLAIKLQSPPKTDRVTLMEITDIITDMFDEMFDSEEDDMNEDIRLGLAIDPDLALRKDGKFYRVRRSNRQYED